jgi:flagellar biosynthesis protein FliQ
MHKQLVKDALGWGFALWLIGYALGMILFAVVPVSLIGWIIMPIGIVIALWVAFRKVNGGTLRYYLLVALTWTLIAVLGDYLFIVRALKPSDGYYKLDVYLYYALTLAIPLLSGWRRTLPRAPDR